MASLYISQASEGYPFATSEKIKFFIHPDIQSLFKVHGHLHVWNHIMIFHCYLNLLLNRKNLQDSKIYDI